MPILDGTEHNSWRIDRLELLVAMVRWQCEEALKLIHSLYDHKGNLTVE